MKARWPVIEMLAKLLPNPRTRGFSLKRVIISHCLEKSRPCRKVTACPGFSVGYKSETVVSLSKGKSCVTSKHSLQQPLALLKNGNHLLTSLQRHVLMALMPLLCVPYAEHALCGETRQWVVGFLLAWGKVSMWNLRIPDA